MKNLIHICLPLLISVALVSCSSKDPAEKDPLVTISPVDSPSMQNQDQAARDTATIDTDTDAVLLVTGYLEVPPKNQAAISPYFGGFVTEIKVIVGQKVSKGEVLFTLENPEYLSIQQHFLEAKGELEYLQADYERQKALAEDQISSQKDFKKAESAYKVMLARYHSFLEQVKLMGLPASEVEAGHLSSRISVKAPMSGFITKVHISRGVFSDAKTVALEMVNLDHLHLELDVFEKDLLKLKVGQAITFYIPEASPKPYQGEVFLVSKSVDPQTHTSHLHGHISSEDADNLLPGMFVQAEIRLD